MFCPSPCGQREGPAPLPQIDMTALSAVQRTPSVGSRSRREGSGPPLPRRALLPCGWERSGVGGRGGVGARQLPHLRCAAGSEARRRANPQPHCHPPPAFATTNLKPLLTRKRVPRHLLIFALCLRRFRPGNPKAQWNACFALGALFANETLPASAKGWAESAVRRAFVEIPFPRRIDRDLKPRAPLR